MSMGNIWVKISLILTSYTEKSPLILKLYKITSYTKVI